jgi:hypothetical protein
VAASACTAAPLGPPGGAGSAGNSDSEGAHAAVPLTRASCEGPHPQAQATSL